MSANIQDTIPIDESGPADEVVNRIAQIIPFPRNRMMLLSRLILVTEEMLASASLGVSRKEAEFLHCYYDHARYRFQIDAVSFVEVTEREDLYRFVSNAGCDAEFDYRCSDIDTMAEMIVEYILERVEEKRRKRVSC